MPCGELAERQRDDDELLAPGEIEDVGLGPVGGRALERPHRRRADQLAGALSGGQVHGGRRRARRLDEHLGELLGRRRAVARVGELGQAGDPPGRARAARGFLLQLHPESPLGEAQAHRADRVQHLVPAERQQKEPGAAERDRMGARLELRPRRQREAVASDARAFRWWTMARPAPSRARHR